MKDRIQICYALIGNTADPGRLVPFVADVDGNIGVRLLFEGSVPINGQANNADGVAVATTGVNLKVANYPYGFNGSTWDRLRSYDITSASILPANKGALGVMGSQWVFSGSVWIPAVAGSLGGNFGSGQSVPINATCQYGFDGTSTWIRIRSASATNIGSTAGDAALIHTQPGEWTVNHAPAANTTATATKAAGGSGVRHVCKGFSVSINGVAAIAAPLVVNLRDGATGAGTILWTERLMAPAGTTTTITRDNLNIVGSANTAMTLEFTAAPGATNFENVNLNGYSTSG